MNTMSQTNAPTSLANDRPGPTQQAHGAVAWSTVIPLAVAMAYADGFWMTTLRGAVGAIERTQGPFASWVRESTLNVPLFAFAVLGALTIALRRFGPVVRGWAYAGTALMIVAGGTLVGIAQLCANSAYDYHLQSQQLQRMAAMRGTSAANLLTSQQEASLGLQLHSLAYGAAILLVTNLILVGWVVAMRGGRLDVVATPGHAPRPAAVPAFNQAQTSGAGGLRLLLAAGLIGSAAIHAAVIPAHLDEWGAAGAFFIALVCVEVALAVLLLTRTQPVILLAAATGSIGPLLIWLYSRTIGIPFGPPAGIPESVGMADVAACVLEASTLALALILLRGNGWLQRPARSAHLRSLAVLAIIAVTTIGLSTSGLGWFDNFAGPTSHTVNHG